MTAFILLKEPTLDSHGYERTQCPDILNDDFQDLVTDVYGNLNPAINAVNKNPRGIRWGIYGNETLIFNDDPDYRLDSDLNAEEKGNTRTMTLLPDHFCHSTPVRSMIEATFSKYYPGLSSYDKSYIVQLSAIRYAPTLDKPCFPSPVNRHKDGFNNAIFTLNRSPGIQGGENRIYDSKGNPLMEVTTEPGDGLLVDEEKWGHFHQVGIMTAKATALNYSGVHRDILIVRINPAKR